MNINRADFNKNSISSLITMRQVDKVYKAAE